MQLLARIYSHVRTQTSDVDEAAACSDIEADTKFAEHLAGEKEQGAATLGDGNRQRCIYYLLHQQAVLTGLVKDCEIWRLQQACSAARIEVCSWWHLCVQV